MSESLYHLRYDTITIGVFVEDNSILSYLPYHNGAEKFPVEVGYPTGLFKLNKSHNPWTVMKGEPRSNQGIRKWLSERVFSPNRPDVKELLKKLGLEKYDVWAIIKKTGGRTHHDKYSIGKANDPLNSKNIIDSSRNKNKEKNFIQDLNNRLNELDKIIDTLPKTHLDTSNSLEFNSGFNFENESYKNSIEPVDVFKNKKNNGS
ncbi:hypothetical protein [Paenibacillus herberti]|uniref:Uncharacterized protein n=1 Tax=Paenibacillus herberti TaxID=1619309 RepID=A0A229P1I5_9BACL|nr:hypothetical protein [Paenibacillus herberti]OXM16136.1 hypothetical protein CGZ75_05385 [Paenibacillus herberti]